MFLAVFALVALATVPLLGGALIRLSDLRIRSVPLVVAALGLQILVISVMPDGSGSLLAALHLASYGLAGLFLWRNRTIPGSAVLACGWFLNTLVIALNGGVMPASLEVIDSGSRGAVAAGDFLNSQPVDGARLAILGDNFALPEWFPFHNVFSIGDVLIGAGVFITFHWVCRSLLPRVVHRLTEESRALWGRAEGRA